MDGTRLPSHLVNEPFGRETARVLSRNPRLFEVGRVYRRQEITSTLHAEFKHYSGDARKEEVARALKGWLRSSDCPFKPVSGWGRYEFLGYGDSQEQHLQSSASGAEESGPLDGALDMPDLMFGDGPYEVYAWFLPRYQTSSRDNRWPIKVGHAGLDGLSRRILDFSANLPEQPRYLLRIGCADEAEARKRESLLHSYFDVRGRKIEDLPGNEWFSTNKEEVREAVEMLMFPNESA